MTDFYSISDLSFPNFPESILSNTEAREAIVKSSAYFTLALEEANINHTRDNLSAMVTDATYELQTDCSAEEYLELCVQELAIAEGNLPEDSNTRDELQVNFEAIERRQ